MRMHRALSSLMIFCICGAPLFGQANDEHDLETISAGSKSVAASAEDLAPVAERIVGQTNQFRKSQELSPVVFDPELTAAAEYFANYMARTDRYGHTADDKRPADRAREHGYEYCIVSENIAYQYNSAGFADGELAEKFVDGWKNSPGHRKNMLEPYVTETGVAVAQSNRTGYYYAVQMFGRPKSKSIEFSIKNEAEQTVQYSIGEQTFSLPPRYTRTHSRCRPPEVQLALGEKAEAKTLQPQGGESYLIALQNGELSVGKQ